jgi:hypothetical protein
MKKSEFMQLWESFRKYFWKSLNLINFCEIYPTWELAFDILAFESFLVWYGYNDETDWSIKDYVKKEFWTEASEFIEYLLN